MTEPIKVGPQFDQLGLPPMELAESNERSSRFLYRCLYPTLQKTFMLVFMVIFSIATYVLLLKLLENTDYSRSTEIIVVTGLKDTPNITLHQNDMKIIFQFSNISTNARTRRKRNIAHANEKHVNLEDLKEEDLQRVKEIILQHRTLCHEKEHEKVCQDLVTKLKSIIQQHEIDPSRNTDSVSVKGNKRNVQVHIDGIIPAGTDKHIDNAQSLSKLKGFVDNGQVPIVPLNMHPTNAMPHAHMGVPPPITNTCLLAKLLKQNYPHVHGIYDSANPEYPNSYGDQPLNMRYFDPPMHSYTQSREMESHKQKLHPQDIDILMSFLSEKSKNPEEHNSEANATARNVECPSGSRPCDRSDDCVEEKQWCDGTVDCADASDELQCSCKSRVDPSRLCDGYFDCPFGEDEMGCFGCADNTFSCGDINLQSSSTCFTKEQRCNNEVDCPNHKDEIECNMLAPSLHKKPLFAISNTEGYLHRNFKGDWYAVCQNPYMWAHDACRRETGLIIRPPIIQMVPINPLLKVNYMNTGPGGSIQSSDTCFNSSAVYVTCPDFLCGTRVSTTSQLLRENTAVENHLFGRNKRFLFSGRPYEPYHMMYYRNRMKRETSATDIDDTDIDLDNSDDNVKDERNKRAESRVVGGKPSQPAAWPWMVAIYRDGMFHCGGVILTQSWIISAAHCVHKFWDHYYEIQVGMLRRFSFSPQERNHRVTHVIVNQHYSQVDMKDDLSLLKVEQAIQFSRWVRPICLPGPNTAGNDWLWGPPPGTKCTAIGWGATIEHGPDPDHMREVEVPIWENCKHREDRAGGEICAGLEEGGKDACQGDSGGPLLCRNPLNSQQWYLAGIVSHGDGCARKGEPGVYTRVSLFIKWIKYHTSSKSLPLVQPLQECPGFKCISGISKCLPDVRKCDRIVDCLDAEDEMNCVYTDMRSVNSSVSDKIDKSKDENKSTEKRESVINSVSIIINTQSTPINVTEILTTESAVTETFFTSTVADVSTTHQDENDNQAMESITDTKVPDFEHASTLEIPTSSSSEESESSSTESVTVDPTSNENTDTSRGDVEHFSMVLKPETLESRSSVLEATKIENEEARETNIVEEWTEFSTTVRQTIDNDAQNSKITVNAVVSDSNSQENITVTEATQTDKLETKSEEIVINLLPSLDSNSSEANENSINTNENNKQDKGSSEFSLDSVSGKSLLNLESKNDIRSKIEDIVFSELQPANVRRKNRIPKQFECRRIFQMIPHTQRCDHKADCEDGTDELGCTCIDYLSTYDENLLCDGIFDCSDGQDEIDCYSCPDQHFLCKRSEICLPTKYVCDGKAQCPLGEDELNCFALSNGKEMFYDIDDKPRINLEGYLTKRNKDDWQVVCEENLSVDQQEQSATHICHYLGFSAANRYSVKYINVKEEDIVKSKISDKRYKRSFNGGKPIHFAYRSVTENDETARNIVITEPQLLKEGCVPNVTKTCKSLYVYCDRSLYTNFDVPQNLIFNRAVETPDDVTTDMWPWIAKVFVEGSYKCTGILVDASWVLVSDACLWDASSANSFVSVILGSHRTLNSIGAYEKAHEVDAKKELYRNRVVLLHLKVPAEYSNQVKPMIVSSPFNADEKTICVAIGQDNRNNSVSVFLNETTRNCNLSSRCFIRRGNTDICSVSVKPEWQWAGLISCHNEQGWHPVASFVDSRGECGIGDTIIATDIENLRQEIRYYSGKPISSDSLDDCEGTRCGRGRCVPMRKMCDGVQDCEDGNDESDESCRTKKDICEHDPYHKGCECTLGQMKCRNGKCVSKELFRDGSDDCGDGTDEPIRTRCSDYLARAMPARLCDGILHCLDRSDEDPMYCKCFAKRSFKCGPSNSETEHCVAPDMVCDGVRDCPNGEDERTCIGLSAPKGALYGVGQVMLQSHGVWRSKCYPTQEHTKSELEAICRELGFLSGHAKEMKAMKNDVNTPNNIALQPFSEIILNNQTVIKMRNTNEPIAKAVFDADLNKCYPVFIECM